LRYPDLGTPDPAAGIGLADYMVFVPQIMDKFPSGKQVVLGSSTLVWNLVIPPDGRGRKKTERKRKT